MPAGALSWEGQHRANLTRIGDQVHLDAKCAKLMGKLPTILIVAGMTPTIVSGDFSAAVINAGDHIGLAGGPHFSEAMLPAPQSQEVISRIEPGNAIGLNMMFLNARLWSFQYPLVQALRREWYPVEGVCVAAGLPLPDVASESVTALVSCGIKLIAFKPGSADTVVPLPSATRRFPSFCSGMTGGPAGIICLKTCARPFSRTMPSSVCAATSSFSARPGFGDVDDTLPCMTGDRSLAFNFPRMPLLTRCFAGRSRCWPRRQRRLRASAVVKDVIAACRGVDHETNWVQSCTKPTGGIITVQYKLDEFVHKVATPGMLPWKEPDDPVFILPGNNCIAVVREKNADIIDRLNKDTHRAWFRKMADGSVAMDLDDMASRHAEVVTPLVKLLYLPKLSRWIDASCGWLLMDVLIFTR